MPRFLYITGLARFLFPVSLFDELTEWLGARYIAFAVLLPYVPSYPAPMLCTTVLQEWAALFFAAHSIAASRWTISWGAKRHADLARNILRFFDLQVCAQFVPDSGRVQW